MHKPPVYIPEIGAAILRFPLDVLKSHYSKPNISPERRAWLSDIFEKAIGTLYELKENGPVTVLLDDVQDVIMPTE
ncbi:hypothetical protein GQ42DRAFT_165665 [Ramicandelaber brevisporus]|nr:hypothetical protein GQ42DRAFT_165665 [Ramicandelaber brevisporus]